MEEKEEDYSEEAKLAVGLHPDFSNCDDIRISFYGEAESEQLPIICGKSRTSEEYYYAIGFNEAPLIMSKEQLQYFLAATQQVISVTYNETHPGEEIAQNIQEALDSGDLKISLGKGAGGGYISSSPGVAAKQLEDLLDKLKTGDVKLVKGGFGDISTEKLDAAKKELEDFKETYEQLTPEEQKVVNEDIKKKEEELVYNKAKALEKDLLGEIELEEKIEYNYEYFKNIYDKKGPEFMREELAKIPKEERKAIISKIIQEVKDEKQSQETNESKEEKKILGKKDDSLDK